MTKEKKKEFTLRISQAGEGGLTVILYEITLEYLKDARESFQKGDLDSFTEDIHHAQDCIRLQQSSLQMSYEPASTLLSLYVYLHAELSKALIEMDASHLDICEKVETDLWKAYTVTMSKRDEVPLMANSQKIYAGLTYGRNSMVENNMDLVQTRGYFA